MADKKISELTATPSVASGDLMVVVTGVGTPGATLVTHKFPLSGLVNNIVNINELITSGTGLHIVPTVSANLPNTVNINVTGYAYTSHTHTASNITDFSSAISGQIQQIIKYQSTDLAATGSLWVQSSDLSIPLSGNSKYLCELGTIFVGNEVDMNISGSVAVTGTMAVNYPTQMYGTWNYYHIDNQGVILSRGSTSSISGYGLVIDTIHSSTTGLPISLVNKFVVETTSSEADTIRFDFTTDSTVGTTSGVLKKGSWLKAEKII